MTIQVGGQTKRFGLALSGGGFRAAAFHLGVFRKLHEAGLLWKLDLLRCVSGGSIAGAFLASHWEEDDALEKLERYLASASIAVSSVLGGMLDPFHTRLDKLAASYERDLYGKRSLGSLKDGPRLYVNATNLATGNMFFFVTGGKLPADAHVFTDADAARTRVFRGVPLEGALARLHAEGVANILLEGGAGLVQRVSHYLNPSYLGEGQAALETYGLADLHRRITLKGVKYTSLGNDLVLTGRI